MAKDNHGQGAVAEGTYTLTVKPNASRTFLSFDDGTDLGGNAHSDDNTRSLRIHVAAQPEDGKANAEIIRFFKKRYRMKCTIIAGRASRRKLIRLSSL